jgi:hypothetical protein
LAVGSTVTTRDLVNLINTSIPAALVLIFKSQRSMFGLRVIRPL